MIPLNETLERLHPILRNIKAEDVVWGWPKDFINLAHKYHSKVYASMLVTPEDWMRVKDLDLDRVMTEKIEVIGPLVINLIIWPI